MIINLTRKFYFEDRTIGIMTFNFTQFYTLEDKDRGLEKGGQKIPKKTAIPKGTYKLTISWSNRFHNYMPHILDVPQFTGIRIHAGNRPEDTEGCILIGKKYDERFQEIRESRGAFREFMKLLREALKTQEVWLKIE